MSGVLIGGWVADRTDRHLAFVVVLTVVGAALLLWVELVADAAVGDDRRDVRRPAC